MKLEVLQADKGDCLLLHAQTESGPALIVVDGGPGGVFDDFLEPRLEEIRQERIDLNGLEENEPLIIDLLMVSHVDDDHINGVIDLLEAMVRDKDQKKPPRYRVLELWHNSFDRVLGNDETKGLLGTKTQFGAASTDDLSALVEDAEEGAPTDHAKVLASVKQGDDLKRLADALGIGINTSFGGKLISTIPGELVARSVGGIEFVVLGPRLPELEKLQEEFDKWLAKQPFAERTPKSMLSALDDESAANLSSLVVLARKDGKSILLTGDARSDKVLEGLKDCRLCGDEESLEVGILKMPHHGSIRNLDEKGDFLRRITSRNYVFSGNGEHGNPDRETFDLLFKTRPGAAMNLYLTYPIEDMDPVRKKIHEKERSKALKKQKPYPEWTHPANSLQAALKPEPAGVTVVVHDGSPMIIEPSA